MAINTNDYPHKIENNLWSNKNYTIFFYNFMFERKRYRGLIDLSDRTSWNKKDKIFSAKAELMKIKHDKKDIICKDVATLHLKHK